MIRRQYIAFPTKERQEPLNLRKWGYRVVDWEILIGPTESGLWILRATDNEITNLRKMYDGLYWFMEDFEPPTKE